MGGLVFLVISLAFAYWFIEDLSAVKIILGGAMLLFMSLGLLGMQKNALDNLYRAPLYRNQTVVSMLILCQIPGYLLAAIMLYIDWHYVVAA